MTVDSIYAGSEERIAPFSFDETVVRVFPDMIRRSVPGYAASLEIVGRVARRHAAAGDVCYDLGCSLGAATLAMRHGLGDRDCRIVAVDSAPAMIARCEEILAADAARAPVELRCEDLRETPIAGAGMVVLNYTLQFVPPEDRDAVIERISRGLRDGGVCVLSEKVHDPDPAIQAAVAELHHDFKRANDYSELEISRKRSALENVLVTDTLAAHEQRLRTAGFRHVGVCQQQLGFATLLAIK